MLRITKNFTACILISLTLILPFKALADDFYEGEPNIEALSKSVETVNTAKPLSINAAAAVVMDMQSGRVLYEKNAGSKRAIASTTKIMTAILAIENGNLDDKVIISKRAAGIWGSKIKLKAGDEYTLKNLLYGMMLNSGNDAAIAIAEHIGGSVENFAEMMTIKAHELGAANTSFKCPHGLDTQGHYSTAYDMALITRYALANKTFSTIVGTTHYEIPGKKLNNTNEMLRLYEGADGVKTGYTGDAGRCLITSVTRDGWRIISVVLGSPTRTARAQSSKSILDYALNNYKPYTLIKINETIARIPVIKGIRKDVPILPVEELHIPLSSDEAEGLKTRIKLPESIKAPVYANIELGTIEFVAGERVIARTGLKTAVDVRRKEMKDYFFQIFDTWLRAVREAG